MITVDLDLPVPIEEQLCRQLRAVIARGDVRPGDPLPSVRQLADELGIHWNTVARAYRRLENGRLLEDIELFEISLVAEPLQPRARVHLIG